MNVRTIGTTIVVGIASLSIVGVADAATKKPTSQARCHAIVKGKKSWSVKFCPKPSKSGVNGKNGKDGFNGTNGANGANGVQGERGKDGVDGKQGPQGIPGFAGAFYATALYNAGDTNAGAIASVACNADPAKTDYVAISGGVQVLGLDDGANSRNTPVSSSFPGRMDWATGKPKAGRLDGWIIQFGGNAGATSDKHPEKVKVWALCVPNMNVPVNQTFEQVS